MGERVSLQVSFQRSLRDRLTQQVQQALESLYAQGILSGTAGRVTLVAPKQAEHGDFSCAAALALGQAQGIRPYSLAQKLQEALGLAGGLLEQTLLAGPGYLNLYVAPAAWRRQLAAILDAGGSFVRSQRGQEQSILVEFVSANPTGPLHVAHGRGAATGDVVARLLEAIGYRVEREYYVNDLGHQADVMARSVYGRYLELWNRPVCFPADFYPGAYIIDIAQDLKHKVGAAYVDQPEEVWMDPVRTYALGAMLDRIKSDLAAFGVGFDRFVSERELTERVGLDSILDRLDRNGYLYQKDGKKWFRSTAFGDDKDRVVVREDGRPTYFASDIAYHDNKLQRGFTRLINFWGADHGGYVARLKAGLAALGYPPQCLQVVFFQMVSLSEGGASVKMGKRLGTAVWLREILNTAGADATRYMFLTRRSDAHMDFDVGVASQKSLENPVYYAQMGYARLASIGRRAQQEGYPEPVLTPEALDALTLPEELALIKRLDDAPHVVAEAAESLEPHQVVHYVQGLMAQFHSYYTQGKDSGHRVISDNPIPTVARLLLCQGLQAVLHELLTLLGVDAPERMFL